MNRIKIPDAIYEGELISAESLYEDLLSGKGSSGTATAMEIIANIFDTVAEDQH